MDVGLVSFIIRVRNTKRRLLYESLSSALSQTYKNIEVVVVFDKGNPELDEGIKEVTSKFENDSRLRVFYREKSSGLVDAMNYGLSKARGQFIAVLDSDDMCSENRIFHQLQYMLKNKLNLVGSWADVISEEGNLIAKFKPPVLHKDIRKYIMIHNPFYHSSILYERNIVTNVGYYDTTFSGSEEYDFYLRIVGSGYKVGNVPEFLCYLRQRKDSFVATSKWPQRKGYVKAKFNAVIKYRYTRLSDLIYTLISPIVFFVPLGKEKMISSKLGWYETVDSK